MYNLLIFLDTFAYGVFGNPGRFYVTTQTQHARGKYQKSSGVGNF